MIPGAIITEWRSHSPWTSAGQVEQDLIISRALIELYSSQEFSAHMLFRGGTALHKLVLNPAARYSEDLDFVQMRPEPIGSVLDSIRASLDPWLGEPRRQNSVRGTTLIYRVQSELPPVIPLRLKIEINTREHFQVFAVERRTLAVETRWFTGASNIPTYALDELLGTKLRALYQRRKGRDLFDLWLGLTQGGANATRIAEAFHAYLKAEGHAVTAAQLRQNLAAKMSDAAFLSDVPPLLRPGIAYDAPEAHRLIERELLTRV
jgi:predicted nucleotidyltransferase component of viral defense system